MFVDVVKIMVCAGSGGHGLVSFRREKFIDRGGPNGGDGGDGGHVIIRAGANQYDLSPFRFQKLIRAGDGQPGGSFGRHGGNGSDARVVVPVGTLVTDDQTGEVLADFTAQDQEVVVAFGGRGGFGNAHFKSSTNRAPRFAEKGLKGQSRRVKCELKLLAEAGLVGLPNAGKSTFLQATTAARPKIGAYPFTTLEPHLGVTDNGCLLADIPGLIAGAAEGRGLGHDFLRHLERNLVLVHLIDCQLASVSRAYRQIMVELAAYSQKLARLPQLVALTKIDTLDDVALRSKVDDLRQALGSKAIIYQISAAQQQNLRPLLDDLKKMIVAQRRKHQRLRERVLKKKTLPVFQLLPQATDFVVERQSDHVFLVSGVKIETFAAKTDFSNDQARRRLLDIMEKLKIIKELEKQGYNQEKIFFGSDRLGGLTLPQLADTLVEAQ